MHDVRRAVNPEPLSGPAADAARNPLSARTLFWNHSSPVACPPPIRTPRILLGGSGIHASASAMFIGGIHAALRPCVSPRCPLGSPPAFALRCCPPPERAGPAATLVVASCSSSLPGCCGLHAAAGCLCVPPCPLRSAPLPRNPGRVAVESLPGCGGIHAAYKFSRPPRAPGAQALSPSL